MAEGLCNLDKRAGRHNFDLLVITFSILDNVNKVRSRPNDVTFSYRHTGLKESYKVSVCLYLGFNKWKPNRYIDIHAEVC